jgi:hypothetical protein
MGNVLRGEVAFEAGGVRYVLRLGINEMITLMVAWKLPPSAGVEFFQRLGELTSLVELREVFLHGLRRDKPEITVEDAGDVLTQIGFARAGDLITEAIRWACPPAQDDADPGGGTDSGDPKEVWTSRPS